MTCNAHINVLAFIDDMIVNIVRVCVCVCVCVCVRAFARALCWRLSSTSILGRTTVFSLLSVFASEKQTVLSLNFFLFSTIFFSLTVCLFSLLARLRSLSLSVSLVLTFLYIVYHKYAMTIAIGFIMELSHISIIPNHTDSPIYETHDITR
jgi:hypothetical protein